MRRIILMVLKNLFYIPIGMPRLCHYAAHADEYPEEEMYEFLQYVDRRVNKAGRITIKTDGTENLPEKNGFIYFPNHQGLYDVLAVIQASPRPFGVVMKQELSNIFFLKQVFACMKCLPIDRDDIKQSMRVILQVAKEVANGRNFLIFAEGTRSKNGNHLGEFKGGTFRAATKAKCPIVPVALIDSYKSFDTHSTKPQTVQVHFLKPIYYEEYKDMKTTEIAIEVKTRIENAISKYIAA